MSTSGLDLRKHDAGLAKANEFFANIVNVSDSYSSGDNAVGSLAFKIAFVHPEVKKYAISSSARGVDRASGLLNYIPDHIPKNYRLNPVIKQIEAFATGVTANILEGNDISEGGSSLDNTATARTTDQLAGLKIRLFDNTNTTFAITSASKVSLEEEMPGLNMDSLFGYTTGETGMPDSDFQFVKVTAREWEELELYEKWYYYALKMCDSLRDLYTDADPESAGKLVYHVGEELEKLKADEWVNALVRGLCHRILGPGMQQVDGVVQGADTGANFDQLLTAITIFPAARDAIVSKYGNGIDPDIKDSALEALRAADARIEQAAKRAGIGIIGIDSVDLRSVAAGYDTDEATALANRLSMSFPASSTLTVLAKDPEISKVLPKKKARLVRKFSVFAENPDYRLGMVENPEERGAGDVPEGQPDEGIPADGDARKFKKMANMSSPYEISRKVADDVVPERDRIGSVYNNATRLVELDPAEWDVTNAYAVPKMAIPLFVKTIQPPKDNNPASVEMSLAAMVVTTYLILAYSDPESFGYSQEWAQEWDERISGERVGSYAGTEELSDIDSLKSRIEAYFAARASEQSPSNPINFRNDWVTRISNTQLWGQVKRTVATVLYDKYRDKEDNPDYKENLDRLYDFIEESRDNVKRYVFAVKENSRNLPISQDIMVLSASPLSPVSHAATSGTLRLTSGGEGVVTKFGNDLIINTGAPKVSRVTRTAEGSMYDLSLQVANGKTCSATVVDSADSDDMDAWMPAGLVLSTDTDVQNTFYTVWAGLTFCSPMSKDGVPENTLKVPEAAVDTANEVLSGIPAHQASSTVPGGEPLKEFGKRMGSMSSSAITAAQDALAALKGGKISVAQATAAIKAIADAEIDATKIDYHSAAKAVPALKSTLALDRFSGHSTPGSENVAAAVNEFSSLAIARHNKTYTTKTKGRVIDFSPAIQGVSDTIRFCGKPHNDTYENTAERIKAALDAVLADTDGVALIQWPFSVSYDKNPYRMSFTAEKMDIPGSMPASIPAVATLKGIRGSIDRYSPEQLYTDTMTALRTVRKTYTDLQARAVEPVMNGGFGVVKDSGPVAAAKTRLKRRLSMLNSHAFRKAFAGFLSAVCPVLKKDPEFGGNVSLLNFVHTIGDIPVNPETKYADENYILDAIDRQLTLATGARDAVMGSRDRKPGAAELNRRRGAGKLDMLTGTAAEPYIGVDYDDDNSGNALSMSIDEDALAGFDAAENDDFMEVCEDRPMLGMVKCDPVGMKNGAGHLDVNSGLSPDEFATMVRALDSAYDEIVNHRSERYGSFADAKIQEFVKNRVAAYDNAIMAFYRYFDDNRVPARRNLVNDIELILDRFGTAAASCQDESMKPELNEAHEKLTALYQHARSVESDGNAVNLANRVASIMSTGFANVILQLNASLETSMVSDEIPNLKGNRDTSAMGAVNLALQTMHDPGRKDRLTGKPMTRAQTDAFSKANAIVGKEIQKDLMSRNSEVDSLSTSYGRLGLDFTAGAMNSVSPFDDMIRKLGSKNANVYRKTYGGEARTDLCTALLWAITADESGRGVDAYRHVEELVRCIQGIDQDGNRQTVQVPVNVRNFLLGGVRLDDSGEDVDLDRTVEVTFSADGTAVPTGKEAPRPAMRDIGDVISAAGLPNATFGRQSTNVGDLVRQIRTSIVELHLADSRDINREVSTKAAIFGTERERRAVIGEYMDTLRREARTIKTDSEDFIPLATLFSYADLGSLNAAKWEKIKRAARILVDTQDRSLYDRIMKDVFGDAEQEDMGERYGVESNRSAITDKIAGMFRRLRENPQADRDAVVDETLGTPCEGANGATLVDILGEDGAVDLVTDAYEKFTSNGLATLDDRKLRIVADQVAGIHCQTTGDIMARLAGELYDLGTGASTYAETRAAIAGELGPDNELPAEQLIDAFIGKLGWGSRTRPAGFSETDAAIRNTANAVVNGESRKNSDFRNIVTAKNPSDALMRINARKEMKGTHPTVDQEQLDPNSGADAMFRKVYEEVLKADTLGPDELKELDSVMLRTLKTRFTASQVLNDIDSVWKAMAGIIGNAVAGIKAKIKASEIASNPSPSQKDAANLPKYEKKVHDRVCPDDPFDTTPDSDDRTRGIVRINGIQTLLDAVHGVVENVFGKTVSGKSSHAFISKESGTISLPGTGAAFADFLNTFIASTTYWTENTDLETLSRMAADLADPDTQKAIEDETRECIAFMYCWTPSRYQEASISALNAASMQRGMGERSRTTRGNAAEVLEFMADEYPAIVQRVDSNAVDTAYVINGHHLSEEQAEGVINDAYNMFADTHRDEIIDDRYDGKFIVRSADFLDCVKRCANPVKDYPLHSDEITALVMRYLVKKRFVSRNGRGTILFKAMFGTKRGGGRRWYTFGRRWYTFVLPFGTVTSATARVIGQANVSNRGTDWNHFARELDNYVRQKTSKRVIERDNAALSKEARNQLYSLVENVARTITDLCKSRLDALDADSFADLLRATKDSPYELGNFISVYPAVPVDLPDREDPAEEIGERGNDEVLDALVDIHRNRAGQAGEPDAGAAEEPRQPGPEGEDGLPEVHGADGE